jgi:hypothetical protein
MRHNYKIRFLLLITLLAIIVSSCERVTPLDPNGTVSMNPYHIATADIEDARNNMESASNALSALSAIQHNFNPYNFTDQDTLYAYNKSLVANQNINDVYNMISNHNYTNIGNYICDFFDLDSSANYWGGQQNILLNQEIPYWQSQLIDAQNSRIQDWIKVCQRMLNNLSLKNLYIATMIADISHDSDLYWVGDESGFSIANRKLLLFTREKNYYADLVAVMTLSRRLDILGWSGIMPYIIESNQISTSIQYWQAQKNDTVVTSIPYWQEEIQKSTHENNDELLLFNQHMLDCDYLKIAMIDTMLQDLESDQIYDNGTSTSSFGSVKDRKNILFSSKKNYYSHLADALFEGYSLGVYNPGK